MKPELLAPVGGMESLLAAVRSGADAVYFGAQELNARRNADNFDDDSLKEAICYCRTHAVRCYLTLNTLVKDNERAVALSLAAKAWEYGIDGVIVQDIGLAQLLHSNLPKLPLHASTQLSVHSAAALPLLKEMGFCRVVPAREMSGAELKEFCRAAALLDIEVEVFVHGALCMCLSGQCYFSAYLGGRSANRGLCAGTCRLPFSVQGGTGYDLSLKDLSLLSHISALAQMGVTSFKIEGRMKRAEYVAVAVSAFRQALDTGRVEPEILRLLEQVFSRNGFTDGYFTGRIGSEMFGIRSEQDKKDSADSFSAIHEIYRHERQHIPLALSIQIKSGQSVKLTAADGVNSVMVEGPIPEAARVKSLEEARVNECLSKLGGTCYFAKDIDCRLESGLSIPISVLNGLRKQAVEKLQSLACLPRERVVVYPPKEEIIQKRVLRGFFACFSNIEQLLAVTEQLPELVGYSLPAGKLISAFESSDNENLKTLLRNATAQLPRGATDDASTRRILKCLKDLGVRAVLCGNLATLRLTKEVGVRPMGGFGLNLFNSSALESAYNMGLKEVIISPELSGNEIKRLYAPYGQKLFAVCYGRQPLMITRNCPVKNGIGCRGKKEYCHLTDRKGNTFPVVCENGFCEILNTKTTDLSDCLESLSVDYGCLCFATESPEDTKEILIAYRSRKGRNAEDFTRGLFRSGVL